MRGSGYPTYPNFLPPALNFYLHFGQTFHLKKKMEGKACILKDFFFDMNPIALRKAKIVYNFVLFECNRVKRKTIMLSKDIKFIFFALFSYCILFLIVTVKSRYTHSEKKKI